MNIEQDLGIPGLRTHKTSIRPCDFLRKYTITERLSREDCDAQRP